MERRSAARDLDGIRGRAGRVPRRGRRPRHLPVAAAIVLLGGLLVAPGFAGDPPSTEAAIGEAYRALEAGRMDEALAQFRALVARDPGGLAAREGLVWAYVKSGALEDAAREADERLALSGDVAWRKQWIDLIAALPARRPAALAAARALARERPEDAQAWELLARVLATSSEGFAEAVEAHRHALTLVPDDVAARTELGRTLVWSGRYAEAIDEFRLVIRMAPDVAPRTELARALVLSARYLEAIAEYRALLAGAPDTELRKELARTLVWSGAYDEAAGEYRTILADVPDDRAARRGLARALSSANHPTEAIPIFDALIAEDPSDARTLADRAQLARAAGDFATVRRLLEQAATAAPGDHTVDEELAFIAPRTADPGPARRDPTYLLLFALAGFAIATGRLRRTIDVPAYVLLVGFAGGLVAAGLCWFHAGP